MFVLFKPQEFVCSEVAHGLSPVTVVWGQRACSVSVPLLFDEPDILIVVDLIEAFVCVLCAANSFFTVTPKISQPKFAVIMIYGVCVCVTQFDSVTRGSE